ncbi:MAG: hypothetical protein ISR62_00120 [Desulfobacteraceae bacterium]|nr:hypothetical protein [Desulfobacterales bacterium]MBL6966815.1 hypothetical protein [Desulfobacteraceae bacterium]MBL7101546.1 hypothetical protein [Desulfobacteraceae bacterium]MBL7172222.1 hypothetical protein [Desulfobacteraceae bacterium]
MADTTERKNDGSTLHTWRFVRLGGFDQVRVETGADLLALDYLDQKLWAALSCPTHGLEFDEQTLQLIDTDGDGRIRVPEIIAATKWAASGLKNPDDLIRGAKALPLTAIDDSHPEGMEILSSAKQILKNLGKSDVTEITVDDTADTVKIFSETKFNGDGIIPPDSADDDATREVIKDIIVCLGSEEDRSGLPGVSQEKVDKFFTEAQAYADWWKKAEDDAISVLPYGDATGDAAAVFHAVRAKVDDYFIRCRLVEFDQGSAGALNPSKEAYEALSLKDLSASKEDIAAFPLASIDAGKPLPLKEGINPAWAGAVAKLDSEIVRPLLGEKDNLDPNDWEDISSRFSAYESWLSKKEGAAVEPLGLERVREILTNGSRETLAALIEKDKALAPEANAVSSVDRLIRYYRDLYTLLNNFVSFRDFYTPGKKAIFQAGTLYLDARSCDLCVKVSDVGKHSGLAQLSRTYLAYCDCTRKGTDKNLTIAAAFTNGNSDNLRVGRNGVFYDRQGRDWDATIVKMIQHPISVRQAFWSPYKRIAQLISEQVAKISAAREKELQTTVSKAVTETPKETKAGQASTGQAFDIAKFAGIFAAIGLAIGAIGTAIASMVTGFLELVWWQMPVAAFGLLFVISGPSMIVAYLKLRKRNLGPILDASGWAVNTRAMINIAFGTSLTRTAELPPGSHRSMKDPFARKKRSWKVYLLLLGVLVAAGVLWQKGCDREWWKQSGVKEKKVQVVDKSVPAQSPGQLLPSKK